jgi:hypothetical protein
MNQIKLIICYDSDNEIGVKPSVQRAAAVFGFEMRFRGIPFQDIRQIVLPPLDLSKRRLDTTTSNLPTSAAEGDALTKVALDDYLMEKGKENFQALLDKCLKKRSAFPRHPSIRDYINKKMQKSHMSRKDVQALAIAVLSDLDANGLRIKSNDDQTYYFDFNTRKLLRTTFEQRAENVAATAFGLFLLSS